MDLTSDEKTLYLKLDNVIEMYKEEKGMMVRILQKAQDIFGYLPISVQSYISDKLNIPVCTVNGVVSFYSLFSQQPRGRFIVSVCLGTACYVKGAQEILTAIKQELQVKEDETTLDGLFTVRSTRCIGACGLAPVITIHDEVYGRITADDVPGIMHQYKKMHKTNPLYPAHL